MSADSVGERAPQGRCRSWLNGRGRSGPRTETSGCKPLPLRRRLASSHRPRTRSKIHRSPNARRSLVRTELSLDHTERMLSGSTYPDGGSYQPRDGACESVVCSSRPSSFQIAPPGDSLTSVTFFTLGRPSGWRSKSVTTPQTDSGGWERTSGPEPHGPWEGRADDGCHRYQYDQESDQQQRKSYSTCSERRSYDSNTRPKARARG